MDLKQIFVYLIVISLFTGMNNAQTVDSLYEVGAWQGFRSCAVTFTFDDLCPRQISIVLPIFDQYGYKLTFYPVIEFAPN